MNPILFTTHLFSSQVNTIGPYFLSRALLSLVRAANAKHQQEPIGVSRAAIVMMSTAVGSIADNSGGEILAYRSSKVCLKLDE